MPTLDYQSPRPRRPDKSTYEDDQARNQWLVPVILLGVAFVLYFVQDLRGGGIAAAGSTGIFMIVAVVVQAVFVVIAAYITAMVAQVGFGSLWMAILQLVAITMFAGAVVSWLPIGIFGLMVYFGLLIAMISWMMDLETSEAAVFAFVLTFVHIGANVALWALFG